MKDKVIIIGTSEYSEYVYKCIEKDGVAEVVSFAVNKQFIMHDYFNGLPIVALEELSQLYDMSKHSVLITVGYKNMNKGREMMYYYCKAQGFTLFTYISSRAYMDCELEDIGEGCIIMPRAAISPCVKIGVCNVINTKVLVGHTSTIGNFNWFSGNSSTGGDVEIGNNCFFGMNSLVSNGVKIANETFLGIYSYITKDSKAGMAYIGMPAKNVKNMKSKIVIDFV